MKGLLALLLLLPLLAPILPAQAVPCRAFAISRQAIGRDSVLVTTTSRCRLVHDTVYRDRVDTVRLPGRVDTLYLPGPTPTPTPSPTPSPAPTPAPTPTNPGYPNEPAGSQVQLDWDTDFSNLSSARDLTRNGPAWWYVDKPGNLSTGTDATAPVNPAKVGRVRFATGCCDGSGPAQMNMAGPPSGWTTWYVSDWIKFDASFRPHSCCQKTFEFLWSSGGDKWLIVKMDTDGSRLKPGFTTEYAGTATQNYYGSPRVQLGVWYQVEVVLHRSGRVQQWIRQQGGQPQLVYDGTPPGAGTIQPSDLFWWWGYGGLGAYSGPSTYIYHNHIRVSWR